MSWLDRPPHPARTDAASAAGSSATAWACSTAVLPATDLSAIITSSTRPPRSPRARATTHSRRRSSPTPSSRTPRRPHRRRPGHATALKLVVSAETLLGASHRTRPRPRRRPHPRHLAAARHHGAQHLRRPGRSATPALGRSSPPRPPPATATALSADLIDLRLLLLLPATPSTATTTTPPPAPPAALRPPTARTRRGLQLHQGHPGFHPTRPSAYPLADHPHHLTPPPDTSTTPRPDPPIHHRPHHRLPPNGESAPL